MNSVNKTLYIPLYGKAYVSKKGLFLDDKKAEQIWAEEAFALKGKSKSKWLAYYMGIRAAVFDEWVKAQIAKTQDAVVLHIGCGMDSRALRINADNQKWYDIDFAEVIEERKRYYVPTDTYKMVAADVKNEAWLMDIPETKHAIVIMEGVGMYLTKEELRRLTDNLCAYFDKVSLLMDCYSVFAAKISKYKNPIKDVGVHQVYGMDDPTLLNSDTLAYVKQHEMTPHKYINELKGIEKFIFSKLYAGGLSKKLYRLFEYNKKV